MKQKRAWLALWLIIFVLVFAWRTQNLDAFGLSNDEGAHLMWAQLAADGFPLYSETYAVQAPLFIEPVVWAFRLAGRTIQSGRWVSLAGFALLASLLSWLAYRAGGRAAAVLAVVLTGISPLIFTFSRLVMAEVPATAMAVASIGLFLIYAERGHKRWLVGSGLILGLSFVIKALNLFLVVPIGLLLLLYHGQPWFSPHSLRTGIERLDMLRYQWRGMVLDSLLWGIAVWLPLATVFLIYDAAAVYDQLIAFRADLRSAIPGSWPETWSHFKLFLGSHWGFGLLAFGSIIATVLRLYLQKWDKHVVSFAYHNLIWVVWLLAGAVMLALHTPLFPHHFIVLLPPLILLAAGLATNLAGLWLQRQQHRSVVYGAAAVLLLAVVGAVFNGPSMIKANQQNAAIVTGGREQEAVRLLEAVTNPNDFLMGDSQLLIFMAKRRTPPHLGDVALVAIKAGRQTSERMIGLTETYRSPAVVQWSLRLPWLPDYLAWVEANYLARRVWDNDHIIYFGRRVPAGQPVPNAQSVGLGEALTLRGYEVDQSSAAAGDELQLTVYWQADTVLSQDYTIFTQLLDGNGSLVAGRDSQPLGGYFPTSQWPANEIVADIVRLSLPVDLPPGDYSLITGMYLLETLQRLPVPGDGGDTLNLTMITIN